MTRTSFSEFSKKMLIFLGIALTPVEHTKFSEEDSATFFWRLSAKLINIFYPSGGPISWHRFRCSLIDVVDYALTGLLLLPVVRVGWVGLDP
jgi:hypothetical protein